MKPKVLEHLPRNETADEWFVRLCDDDEEREILSRDDDGLFKRFLVVRILSDSQPDGKCLHCPDRFHEGPCNTATVDPTGRKPSVRCPCLGHGSPIDMIIHCPKCGTQHVDAPDPTKCQDCGLDEDLCTADGRCSFNPWTNPPHKKHRCLSCNNVFKVANVPTNGVAELQEVVNG